MTIAKPNEIIALEHRSGSRRVWIKHYSNGDRRMASPQEAHRLFAGAYDMIDGQRVEIRKGKR